MTRSFTLPAALACAIAAAGAAWSWHALAERDARIARLEAALRATGQAGALQARELVQCKDAAATLAAMPRQDTGAAPQAARDGRPAEAAPAAVTLAAAPMDLGAALKAFQASQPPPGSAAMSPFAPR